MKSVEEHIRKNDLQSLIDGVNELCDGNVEQHKFAVESKIEVNEWFEFLWKINSATSNGFGSGNLPVVEFNYIEVEDKAVRYVENNKPVGKDELVQSVASSVNSADLDDVDGWIFNMMADTIQTNKSGEVTSLERSFEDSIY